MLLSADSPYALIVRRYLSLLDAAVELEHREYTGPRLQDSHKVLMFDHALTADEVNRKYRSVHSSFSVNWMEISHICRQTRAGLDRFPWVPKTHIIMTKYNMMRDSVDIPMSIRGESQEIKIYLMH